MVKESKIELIELYGLAAAGFVGGVAKEGMSYAKELIEKRRSKSSDIGQLALVHSLPEQSASNVIYPYFTPAESEYPQIAA